MKTELSIQTPSAGIVRIVPDPLEVRGCVLLQYGIVRIVPDLLEVTGCVLLQYLNEATTQQRTAAARYLFDEGFIEFAQGRIELERL
ncbi:MAG TPA: hypothetical protein VHS80_01075 [Chthoniobacterales bacterium]|jgi:hypothetical protein|nr:hypothetical protein [Chthoniobacterales bacterium]